MQDSWKMWENAYILSLRVGDFSYAVRSIHRLLDIRGKEVKFSWIQSLAKYVTTEMTSSEERSRTIGTTYYLLFPRFPFGNIH